MSRFATFRRSRRVLLALLAVAALTVQDATADTAAQQDELDQILDYLIAQKLVDRSAEQEAINRGKRAQLRRPAVGMSFDATKLRPLDSFSSKFAKDAATKKKAEQQ